MLADISAVIIIFQYLKILRLDSCLRRNDNALARNGKFSIINNTKIFYLKDFLAETILQTASNVS